MSKYYLTEAYGELYNPRKADETFYENLRFVDYLMQEEIEEVMESLLWEFMDYGNTLDESYGLIKGVFSDDVILEEVLTEARMSPRQKEERAARVRAETQETLKQVAKQKATQRREARKAAVTNALKKAYGTVKDVATGAGRAAMSGLRQAKSMAGTAYDRSKTKAGEAQAGLAKLVRGGALKAVRAGGRMERAGKAAKTTYTVGAERGGKPVGKPVSVEVGGAKRRALGKVLRRAGAAVYGAMSGGKKGDSTPAQPRMTRADLAANNARRAAAARSAVADTVSSTAPKPEAKKPELGFKKLEASGQKPVYNPAAANRSEKRRTGGKLPASSALTPWNKGPDKSGKQSTAPSTIQAQRRNQIRLARTQREEFELLAQYILEDFINEGYANNYEDALEILENLSENSIIELTEMYLEG